jgi:hypothetical protein
VLKPVDLQTIMPRSVDLQKVQQISNTRYITEQQAMEKQVIEESEHRQKQVQEGEASSEGNRIRDERRQGEGKGRKYRRFSNGSKQGEIESDEASNLDDKRGNIIDIKI